MGCAAPNEMHWEDLRRRSPDEILLREGVESANEGTAYRVRFLNSVCLVDPAASRIVELEPRPDRQLTEQFQILLIRYLVAPVGGPEDGEEISEKDLPGGVTFFQGPHALYVMPVERTFGADPEAFEVRSRELGAEPVPHGDKGMRFRPFPQMPVTYVLWKSDDEFPASVSVLFDRSIGRWFELDMVFALVWTLTERIIDPVARESV